MTTTVKPLTEQPPTEIDEQLYAIWARYYVAMDDCENYRRLAAQGRKSKYTSEATVDMYDSRAEAASLLAEQIWVEMGPFNREFDRRGGWTRAYLVDNTGGHVHRTRACNTCFPSTKFYWVTELSGHSEAKIVEAAGEKACTVCYPSAPVDVLKRKSTIETAERRANRIERETKAAAKLAKQLIDPDTGKIVREVNVGVGRMSHLGVYNGPEIGKTERGAELAAISGLASLRWYSETHPSAKGWIATAERVAKALAAKRGTTYADELATLNTKADASHKRTQRDY